MTTDRVTNDSAAPRIAPLEPPYEPDIEAMLQKWMPPNSDMEPLRLFRTLGVHSELAARMRPVGAGILGHGLVEPRLREVMIHRTCRIPRRAATSAACDVAAAAAMQ